MKRIQTPGPGTSDQAIYDRRVMYQPPLPRPSTLYLLLTGQIGPNGGSFRSRLYGMGLYYLCVYLTTV